MTPRDRRPDNEQGPVNWGIMPKRTPRPKNSSTRPGGSGRLETVRSGNNPTSAASTAPAATGASAASASGSADGVPGARGAGGAAVMTEEDMRSAAAQAIASGTADAVDAAIAIDLADVAGDDSGWADSAVSAGSPASPVTLRAVDSPVEDSEAHGEPSPTGASVPPTGNSAASAPGSAAAAAQQDRAVAGVVNDSRSSRPVVRPTAVDGTGSNAPRSGGATTRVFTISQGRPTAVPSGDSGAGAPSQPTPASAPAPDAGSPSTGGSGYQARPSASSGGTPTTASQTGATATGISAKPPTSAPGELRPEEDVSILAESSAWEAATNALDSEEIKAQGGGTDWGVGRGPAKGRGQRRPSSGTDWGVGRGPAKSSGARPRSPWPAAVRRQRLVGVVFALLGLVLATVSAMNLARNAEVGQLWIPPWLVAVLGGAGLVAAAGYLAWAGGTPVRREAERWKPGVLDAAAGLTTGTVKVNDPDRLVARARGPLLLGTSVRGDETAPTVDSGPKPIMGTSTVDQSTHAPAGVAGAVGGFMLASAVVCAVVALILGPSWLIATAALTLGGIVAIRLAGEWLGQV
ncbi:hypothetical protein BKH09_04170 [Actinomyces naeslundii]|uniref:hypothetical protein n=1 Tax=Actinomyces naeslundii TaxID=1655 RepID=UPI00094BF9C6|nr:hypothetical protein [Actinomyces naeslundii]OLO92892.1 hypothetical protein BKH09_04170 [Actinomyces naeslundii]